MARFARCTLIVAICGSIAWACSGAHSSQVASKHSTASGTGGHGVVAGSGGVVADSGGVVAGGRSDALGSGGGTSGTSAGHGGSAGSGSGAGGSGGSTSQAGASGAAGSGGGSSGAGGASTSALDCAKDDDCIVAYAHTNTGCCFRGCGSAFNRNYVASEPCVATDAMTDPVPASCDTGCVPCPGSACQQVYGAVCLARQCTSVTEYGPCVTDADCVVAIDYASTEGACCACPEITTKLVLANDRCVVLRGQPKPSGCAPTPADICKSLGCPTQCPNPTLLKCDQGMCTGS